jgi:23S rRNA (cytidine1920-2'-O)/16S rRNA (cytidine1409-2'-O)-methyltransferase
MRLDNYLVKIELFETRTKAQQAILRKEIFLNGNVVDKCSYSVDESKDLDVKYSFTEKYVSLGGYKLKKALDDFNFVRTGLIVADIGASTGGFTDCLLKSGANKVYSVDLNDELLHDSLKKDERVVQLVKNAKELNVEDFADTLDLIVADLSFISLKDVVKVFSKLLNNDKRLIVLIKPQFETGTKKKFKNGIIKDKKLQIQICKNIFNIAVENSLSPIAFTTAPKVEGKNLEFLMMFKKNAKPVLNIEDIK